MWSIKVAAIIANDTDFKLKMSLMFSVCCDVLRYCHSHYDPAANGNKDVSAPRTLFTCVISTGFILTL